MVSDPDLNHVKASLEKLDFLVVQDIFLTETAGWRTWSCPQPLLPKRRGPSPTPRERSSVFARPLIPLGRRDRTGGSSLTCPAEWAIPCSTRTARRHHGGNRRGDALLLRNQLRSAGNRGHPLALHRDGPPRDAMPPRGPVHMRSGRFSRHRVYARRRNCPIRSIPFT